MNYITADKDTREKFESVLLYSTAFALFGNTRTLNLSTRSLCALAATTLFLRPKPEEVHPFKNFVWALGNLVDGYLFWKALAPLLPLKDLAQIPFNSWTVGALVWGGLRMAIIYKSSSLSPTADDKNPYFPLPSRFVRKRIDTNLFYSALFALCLNSSSPLLMTSSLAFGTTFLFRPDNRRDKTTEGTFLTQAGFTLAHLIDGYLLSRYVPLLSQGGLTQLFTTSWGVGISVWCAARAFSIVSKAPLFSSFIYKTRQAYTQAVQDARPQSSKTAEPIPYPFYLQGLPSLERRNLETALKYGLLFTLHLQSNPSWTSTALLFGATTLFLRPDTRPLLVSEGQVNGQLRPQFLFTVEHLIDAFFFCHYVVPLVKGLSLGVLPSSLDRCLWTAGMVVWYGLRAQGLSSNQRVDEVIRSFFQAEKKNSTPLQEVGRQKRKH